MTTTTLSTIEAKDKFVELVNRVYRDKERIVLTRREKEIAALIPLEDLYLLLASQNKNHLDEATKSLQEARKEGFISLETVMTDLLG